MNMLPLRRILIQSSLINNQFKNYSKIKLDPGIKKRKNIFVKEGQVEDDIEELDDYETDFMNVHKTHREHVEEMEAKEEKLKYYITRQKYFKEKYPNFLTWHDKEQIKYLHSSDPEEWTIEKLSEGFPALPEVIAKVVKGKWSKKNQNKMTNHDKAVQDNWRLFKRDKLNDLPVDLTEHLKKFTNRALTLKPFQTSEENRVVDINHNNYNGEFSEIINSYEKFKSKNKQESIENKNRLLSIAQNKHKVKDKHLATLTELQKKIEHKIESGEHVTEDERILVEGVDDKEPTEIQTIELNDSLAELVKNKYSTDVASVQKTEKDYNHLVYPEKITIPKKLRKRNCLYKLNDCFYDDYGDFLYRVPGME